MDIYASQLIRSSIIGIVIVLSLLFIPAGTLNYWQGWVYTLVFISVSTAYTVYLAKHDPALLKRRTEAGISYEKEPAQKIIISLLFVICIALVILSALDARFGWSYMQWYISILGDLVVVFSFYVFHLVSKVNTYAAANIRVEEGQQVISSSLYGFVRHPMYLGAIFFSLVPQLLSDPGGHFF